MNIQKKFKINKYKSFSFFFHPHYMPSTLSIRLQNVNMKENRQQH